MDIPFKKIYNESVKKLKIVKGELESLAERKPHKSFDPNT